MSARAPGRRGRRTRPDPAAVSLAWATVTIRPIVICGEPVLHRPTTVVSVFDDELQTFIDDLFETNAAANGAGLAANQVGDSRRVFVYDCPDDAGVRHRGYVVNPVLETSEVPQNMPDPEDDLEGCLSVPGEHFPAGRASWARVTGVDATGAPIEAEGTGLLRSVPATRDRPPGRPPLSGPVDRAQRPQRPQVRQGARLGGARLELAARDGPGPVRPLNSI